MKHQAVIFDLDGTLLNTLGDVADSMNMMLEESGFPTHSEPAYKNIIGDGLVVAVRRALPSNRADEDQVAAAAARFTQIYMNRWHGKTKPFPGVVELLEQLKERGLALGVCSNKPHDRALDAIRHYFGLQTFAVIVGHRNGTPLKPDPSVAVEVAESLAVEPSLCIFVGDTGIDMTTAVRASMTPVGVGWGFREREELWAEGARHVIEIPAELLDLL